MRKYIIMLLIFIITIISFNFFNFSYSTDSLTDIFEDGDLFLEAEKDLDQNGLLSSDELEETQENLGDVSGIIYNIFLGIGMVVAVAVGSFLGIKFMVSSVDEKAEIKKILIVYIVGCVVLFGAFGIWKLVVNLLNNV